KLRGRFFQSLAFGCSHSHLLRSFRSVTTCCSVLSSDSYIGRHRLRRNSQSYGKQNVARQRFHPYSPLRFLQDSTSESIAIAIGPEYLNSRSSCQKSRDVDLHDPEVV